MIPLFSPSRMIDFSHICAFFGLLLAFFVYRNILAPYLLFIKYVKYGRGEFYPLLGVFYGAPKRVKKYNDADYHLKHMFEGVEDPSSIKLYVENNPSNIVLKLADVEYIKEFVQMENINYEKSPILIDNLVRLVGRGIIFSEGPMWKKNRSVLQGVFHFESLQRRVPLIDSITKDIFLRYINEGKLEKVDMIEIF